MINSTSRLAALSTVPHPANCGYFVHRMANCGCRPSPARFGHDPNCQSWDWRCDCDWCWDHRIDALNGYEPELWPGAPCQS